jgi:hypothetical protein
MEDDSIDLKQKRLKAVLAYDGIDENKMHLHLAKLLQVSNSVAKRMLYGDHRTILKRGIDAARALDVTVNWLYFGEFSHYHNRTMRIHVQAYKGYPKAITDKAMRFHFAVIAGQAKALNLLNLVSANKLNYVDALEIHQPH